MTTFELLRLVEKETGHSYFHTGTLDPMAEGLVLLIPTKFRFLESKLKNFRKNYTFCILFGFSTDTSDLLGKVIELRKSSIPDPTEVLEFINSYNKQSAHSVSYKNLNTPGKRADFHKNGAKNDILPVKNVMVYSSKFLGTYNLHKKALYNYIENKLQLLNKDFRQESILQTYSLAKKKFEKQYCVYEFEVTVSSGFYIRSLVRDISMHFGIPLCTYKIKRNSIGLFKLS